MPQSKKQYYGLDVLKFIMAALVVARHVIQIYFPAESRWHFFIGSWLSNTAVPTFFTIAGFLLFRKLLDNNNNANVSNASLKSSAVWSYVCRILKLYILWSIIYWPVDIYNSQPIGFYLHSFLMSSTIVQLWYLPALAVAVLIVGLLYKTDAKPWLVLLVTGALLVLGWTVDNYKVFEHAPQLIKSFAGWYAPIFLTMRNGVFYGSFYVGLGAFIAGRKKHMPAGPAVAGCIAFLFIMYKEASLLSNVNIVLSAAPAVFCLTELALGFSGDRSKVLLFLREQSEWIYFTHYYFIYLVSWTIKYNPLRMTEANIMLCVTVPMFIFTIIIWYLSHKKYGKWLLSLI